MPGAEPALPLLPVLTLYIGKLLAAERQRLSALRADGTIGDAAFQLVKQELDWTELDLQQLLRSEPSAS